MSKYREHTTEQIYKSRINFKAIQDEKYNDIIRKQAEKIQEMAAIMDKAALIDEDRTFSEQEVVSMLQVENKGLRELLQISRKNGNLKTEDKTVQTESSDCTTT
ncbi:hypothetical protein NQ318_012130 [Aromia moschata]|uniref:Uncharacterized protein n=1 Tax=Aromia moschata TaxID=1265417 RepID=A0AAV8YN30_9CUCU|nr:hypothetical protein NQ318_012130 [Aromia moschata]